MKLNKTKNVIITLAIGLILCSYASAGTGVGLSNIFTIDTINAIIVTATNNWDGTVTVTWGNQGHVCLIRQEVGGPPPQTSYYTSKISYDDNTFALSEFKKKYFYILKDLNGTVLGTSQEVMPDIVVVLVKGYDAFGPGKDPNYWYWKVPSDHPEWADRGLVDVKGWLEDKGITCWDASADIDGTESLNSNAAALKTFIDSKRTGLYSDAKVDIFAHSMGGLISRKYACDNHGIVKRIICFQTPHTGSPLAKHNLLLSGIKAGAIASYNTFASSWFSGNIQNDFNVATICLLPDVIQWFNLTYTDKAIGDTKIYSTYSAEWWDVAQFPGFTLTTCIIMGENLLPTAPFFPGTNDGAVPVQSAKGQRSFINMVKIEETYNSNYDHFSCYRHPDVLNQALRWMQFYYFAPVKMAVSEFKAQAEEAPPQPLYLVNAFSGELDALEDANHSVIINASTKAYFMTGVLESDFVFTLKNPLGVLVNQDTALTDPNVTYTVANGNITYEILSPLSGEWVAKLVAKSTVTEPIRYGITVFEDQFVSLSLQCLPGYINTSESIKILANLQNNSGAITGALVSANITLPNNNIVPIILHDDGTNGDSAVDDGIYSYVFSNTSLNGNYSVVATASEDSSTSTFERTAMTSFSATSADIAITGNISDYGVDANENGYFDSLRFKVPVTVQTAKQYRLTASLMDSDDNQISLINSGLLPLMIDSNSVTIDVSAEEIVKHGTAGLFKLVRIEITDANSGLIITTANDYNTSAYSLTDFEPLDTDKDGISDIMELSIGTDPNKVDTDEDGATDYQEISVDGNSTSYNSQTDSNPFVIDTDGDTMTDGYEISYGLNPLIDDRNGDFDGDGLTNIQEYNLHTRPDKIDTDDDGRNDKWELDNSTNPIVYENYTKIVGDINLDAAVNFIDLGIMANQWLQVPGIPSADIAPSPTDGIVNFLDFAKLAESWMQ